jgi:RpiB/LacA/LacB family sugar-phosphate isomerase
MNKKPILLIPMAGLGKRFRDKGYIIPKPLVVVDDKQIIDYSFLSIQPEEYDRIIFVVRSEHINNFSIHDILKKKFGERVEVVEIESLTQGSVCSCLAAKDLINVDQPLVIYTLDVYFSPTFSYKDVDESLDGCVLYFQANSPNYSYTELDENSLVKRTAEKEVISSNALVGIYAFRNGRDFVSYAEKMISQGVKTNGEFYLAPLYNLLVKDGKRIGAIPVRKMYVIGTPEELDFFRRHVAPKFGTKPICLCADHSGFDAKEEFKAVLKQLGLRFIDFGTYAKKDCDYNDYVNAACRHIQDGFSDFGFGFCRSGQGVNIAANKNHGIRAALVFDEYTAEYSVRHNCANFFSIPTKGISSDKIRMLLNVIQSNTFDGGRHSSRIQKLENVS